MTDEKVTKAIECRFDGVDKFDIAQEVLELEAELNLLKSEKAHSMVMCKCTKRHRLPSEPVCKVCKIEELEADLLTHQWVSVKDRLPEINGRFSVVKCNGQFSFCDSSTFMLSSGKFRDSRITHWKRETLPPEKEGK